MIPVPRWYRVALDPLVLRRATISSLGVGILIAVVYQLDRMVAGSLPPMPLFLIGIAFIAPFFVSIAASVGDGFDFERRGIVDVKGKGPIETWFVLGRRGGDAATDAATAPDAQIAAAARGER